MSRMSKFFKSPLVSVADSIYKQTSKKNIVRLAVSENAKKPVVKKPVVKKPVVKKPAVKKPVVKKPVVKKPVETQNRIFHNIQLKNEVALYFSGGMGNLYQIEQWFGPLKELSKTKSFIFIVRNIDIFNWLKSHTDFQIVYCRILDNVMQVYEQGQFKCVLYVNHAQQNFQSLITRNVCHVHINHGESDKLSTISNQTKAYDYVLLVGPAAYDKYNNNLFNKDINRYIEIGRPQLEFIPKIEKPITSKQLPIESKEVVQAISGDSGVDDIKVMLYALKNTIDLMDKERIESVESVESGLKDRRVILYAPTWESTHESMNYTSLNDYGLTIIDAILADPELYLIYKPHPNTGSRLAGTKQINNEIITRVKDHYKAELVVDGDINSLYEYVDIAIFDNSAVAIDYLAVDKPMLMIDMFDKLIDRNDRPFITNAAVMINDNNVENLIDLIDQEICKDTVKDKRGKVKQYFLGSVDYINKESTRNFITTVEMICNKRDENLHELASSQKSQEPIFD